MTEAESVAIHDLFGSFRAEWLREDLYQFFNEPAYFPHLRENKSCVLMGGRGSGKTTVLKCMSYQGQGALGQYNHAMPTFIGLYYRVNTNVVTSFFGPELEESEWTKLFGHFMNLTVCGEIADYIDWYKEKFGSNLGVHDLNYARVGAYFGFKNCQTLDQLRSSIEEASVNLEIYINNFSGPRPTVSQLQSPIVAFFDEAKKMPGHSRSVFHIIFDEYENLLDYQQRIVNTLIKHSGDNYFFKIGVKELGWRVHSTLNAAETLISPADYELIHIESKLKENFAEFARQVCEARLGRLKGQGSKAPLSPDALLPGVGINEEAQLLGVRRRVAKFRKMITDSDEYNRMLSSCHDYELYVFQELNSGNLDRAVTDLILYARRETKAVDRYHNYAYALLFTVADRREKITKFYAGHSTFAKLAHVNIRFYMQLLHESVRRHVESGSELSEPIDPKLQTLAAREVGFTYLRELEGVSSRGGQLSKLLLGFGRLFQILSENPVGGAPECNQFHVQELGRYVDSDVSTKTSDLLREAVMHMALVRSSGTKLTTESDTRSWDYAPHPIFAPFFNFSFRRKRKMMVSDQDVYDMVQQPQETIRRLLGRRPELASAELPTQMSMFDGYFR